MNILIGHNSSTRTLAPSSNATNKKEKRVTQIVMITKAREEGIFKVEVRWV
jgi:hypothetical protein